ncbi:MAG: LPS export ABC transporter permease LptG [Alphaproteobacteria bacterium]|nr:LPS export ABC transporter permease LptG [Alphaproteobacteria bacterium]
MRFARTLSTYIARQFFVWFCGVFGTMVSITFLLDYIELLRRGGTRTQATWGVLLEMAVLKLPHTAQEVMPFAILFGTMLAFWRLTRSNELVVARAAGVSVWGFLTPAITVALAIGVVAITVFNPIASSMEGSYEKLDTRILRQSGDPSSLSNAGLWLRQSDPGGGQIILHGEKVASTTLQLRDPSLYFLNKKAEFTSRIEAKSATLEPGFWHISGGERFQPNQPPQPVSDLQLPTTLTASKIEESLAPPDTMSFWELPGYISLLEQSGFSAQRHRLQFNILLARPLLFCAMVLIAATFSLRMQRRGGTAALIVSGVAAGFLLYFVSDIVFALGLSAKIPVLLAAWTPAGVSLLFGASMLLHLEDG